MLSIVIFIMIILIASILQTSTGFGFSILATPFLLLLFQPAEAIQINLILSFLISFALITKIKQDIDFGVLKRFLFGSVVGLPLGMLVFLRLDVMKLKLGISMIILLLTFMLIWKFRISQTKTRDYIVGGLSGIFTTSIGMPGPPLLLYFAGTATRKAVLRSTTLAFYFVIYLLSIVIQVSFAGATKTMWLASGFALPIVCLGLYIGQLLFTKISERHFQVVLYVILAFTGVYLLLESIKLW